MNAFDKTSVSCKLHFENIEGQQIKWDWKFPLKYLWIALWFWIGTFFLYSMISHFDQTACPPILVEWFSRLLDLIVHFRIIMIENNSESMHVPLQPEILRVHSHLQLVALTVIWNLNEDKGIFQVFHWHVGEDFAYSVEI